MSPHQLVLRLESLWEGARRRLGGDRTPVDLRIEAYLGHGGPEGVVVRGRVLDDPLPTAPVAGEGLGAAVRRSAQHFLTDELPGVPLRITVGDATVTTETDGDGYFLARLAPDPAGLSSPWTTGTVELAGRYRGLDRAVVTPLEVRVPDDRARFGVLSDVDDTVLETGVQRVARMVLQTFTGSALTRTPFAGAAALYRELAGGAGGHEGGANPVFYVSSSPWNLHGFLVAFLRHHHFPLGPVLLRDLLGTAAGREQKAGRVQEVLDLHPQLPFVLVGDSGEHDPEVYAEVVRRNPGRVLAVYIREVRLDPGDGRVERVSSSWPEDVPFVVAADSDAVRRHAQGLGLV